MSPTLLFAVGGLFAGALADLFYKGAQQRGAVAPRLIFVQSTVFTIIIEIFAYFHGDFENLPGSIWLYVLPSGLLNYAGLVFFVSSLRTGDAGVNAPVFRLNFVVTSILAITLLGENVSAAKIAGLILAISAILVLINTSALANPAVRRSILLAAAGTLLFGLGGFLTKQGASTGASAVAVTALQAITFYVGAVCYPLFTGKLPPRKVELQWGPAIGILQMTWSVLTIQSLRTGDASISFPVAQLGFVLTAILAISLFKEAATPAKFLGLFLAAAAVGAFAFA